MKLACIVEGHGDVAAVPILVDRIVHSRAVGTIVDIIRPAHRVPRGKMTKGDDLERAVTLQARKVGQGGAVLIVLDADEDCAASLGPSIQSRVERKDVAIGVVVAVREYEAWLVASARSFEGKKGFDTTLSPPDNIESMSNPKGWLDKHKARGYSETVDQPALTALLDVGAASGLSSFRKLLRELSRLLDIDVTKAPEPSIDAD